jgi:UDPglucose 6-dehydrogenase
MQICVVGTGYVGLVTGACLAALGNRVTCVDNDLAKVDRLQTGDVMLYEPDLSEIVVENMRPGRLKFTSDIGCAIEDSAIIFITVNTPASCDGSADLTQVFNVAKSIGNFINNEKQVIVKSTVPVGTCAEIAVLIGAIQAGRKTGYRCEVAFNPEFLKEGSAVNDFMHPDRIVIGCSTPDTIRLMEELYAPITAQTGCPLLVMSMESAEITKYAANSMLATRISFVNELAKLSELTGADIAEVTRGVGSDPRIGPHFLQAGLGYGGSCFPKDVKALAKTFSDYGLNADLLKAVERINQSQGGYFVAKIKKHFEMELSGKTLAVWGLSFKPETNDWREAPSLRVIEELLNNGVKLKIFDPRCFNNSHKIEAVFADQEPYFCQDPYEAVEDADALIVATEWNCFKKPDLQKIKRLLKTAAIFDGRNIYDPAEIKEAGFRYYSIGRS